MAYAATVATPPRRVAASRPTRAALTTPVAVIAPRPATESAKISAARVSGEHHHAAACPCRTQHHPRSLSPMPNTAPPRHCLPMPNTPRRRHRSSSAEQCRPERSVRTFAEAGDCCRISEGLRVQARVTGSPSCGQRCRHPDWSRRASSPGRESGVAWHWPWFAGRQGSRDQPSLFIDLASRSSRNWLSTADHCDSDVVEVCQSHRRGRPAGRFGPDDHRQRT